ncbi:MAG: phenylalanine--tRNA ligase subunit alpha [Candidatus Bathyarchaeia archaeon]
MGELRENEQKTLLALEKLGGRGSIKGIMKISGLAHAAVMRAALSLKTKKLAEIHEEEHTTTTLSKEGKYHARKGLPERRLAEAVAKLGGEATIEETTRKAGLERKFLTIALGWLRRKGWATVEKHVLKLSKKPEVGKDEKALQLLDEKGPQMVEDLGKELQDAVSTLKSRGLVKIDKKTLRELELTNAGWELVKQGIEVAEEISQLTPELIVSGKWRQVRLRKYNIKAPVAITWPGKKHPYAWFLDKLKEKLVALGFKEMVGPPVELSFFNFDSLYTPQDHPAREIFGVYYIKSPRYGKAEAHKSIVENVRKTHEKGWKTGSTGWRYRFSLRETKRLLLRAHGTALSVRTLLSKDLEIPGKYFAIARCYRPDVVDKTHLTEFNQVEGIVVGEDLALRDLLGVLERFAIDIAGADMVKFRPDYFPFTEPSVELVAYKKDYGWLEFGGSGIFRPEVTLPLGIKVPVLAWGLGVDRLFMMKAGIDDIRYLFSQDLNWIRRKELT